MGVSQSLVLLPRLLLRLLPASAPWPLSLDLERDMGGGELRSRLLPESMSMPVGDNSRLRLRLGVRGKRSPRGEEEGAMSTSGVPSTNGEPIVPFVTMLFSHGAGSGIARNPVPPAAIFFRLLDLRSTSSVELMTMKAPVRPTPAEQCTTIGPATEPRPRGIEVRSSASAAFWAASAISIMVSSDSGVSGMW